MAIINNYLIFAVELQHVKKMKKKKRNDYGN